MKSAKGFLSSFRLLIIAFSILFITPFVFAQTADLIIQSVSTTTGPVAPNAVFSLSNTVKNQGTGSAAASVVAFHLSVNNTYGGADDIVFSQTRNVGTLAAGATSAANTNLTVPASTPLGNYYVCAMADSSLVVTEGNETNNTLCTTSTISVAAAELIMTQVTPNASTVNAGATLSVTNATQNTSTTKTGTLRIAFRLSINTTYGDADDVVISTTRTVSSLNGGATSSATTNIMIPTSTAAGNYYVCAKTDSLSQVIETNENNNTLCSTTTVSVVRPTITGLAPSSGPIGASVIVSGSGFGATQGTSTIKFNGTTAVPTSWSVNSIAAPVPVGATTGSVVVNVAGVASNGQTFTVTVGGSVSYIYDELGRLIGVVDPAGESAIYNYDAVGNLLSITRQGASFVSIIDFTPNSAAVGAAVTIFGTGFSATAGQNTVTFNGITATISSSTTTQIVTSVPASATSGPIVVTSPNGSATSSASFVVGSGGAPIITNFSPTTATVGSEVIVTGTNFQPIISNNVVTVSNIPVAVVLANATSLSFIVPSGATTGRISVLTPYGSSTSSQDLTILQSIISTFAGNGVWGYGGDGGPATAASFKTPTHVVVDASGNVIISDQGNSRIRKVGSNGIITTIVGTGVQGFSGDGGPATNAKIAGPQGLLIDPTGNLFFCDASNNRIRKVDTAGIITTIAGTGVAGFSGDGGPATNAKLNLPIGLNRDSAGNLFIADYNNNRVRKINTSGVISTVAGNGGIGFSGDGGPATSAAVAAPISLVIDASGNIFIAASGQNRIRKVATSGIISTIAGNGDGRYSGDGGLAVNATISGPRGLFIDNTGNLLLSDYTNCRVRKIYTDGIIATVAGSGLVGYSGDGGPATAAQLYRPEGLVIDGQGNLFIADSWNQRIRKVTTSP